MRRVRFDDHRTSSRESGSRVSSRYREGQGEIACSEHSHWPKSYPTKPKIGACLWFPVRQGRVYGRGDPSSSLYDRSEHLQLAHGPATLSLQPPFRQRRLGVGSVNQRVPKVQNALADPAKKTRSFGKTSLPKRIERLVRQCAGAVNILFASYAKARIKIDVRCRVERADAPVSTHDL